LNKINQELEEKIKNQFQESFYKINQAFDRYFKIIFNGGQAKIQLKENASLEGEKEIEILATPPHKKIKNISMLSGGEKALTSLALIAAIISINEPPFVILDEVAASLDPENSAKFAKIIKELRRHTQFIVITHNQEIIEIADVLYGVSMQKNGTSKLISLRLEN
jgi:chromosome segregation protein